MSGDPIRHHVVPEFYLKRFAVLERLMVMRGGQEPFHAKVNQFAVIRHFNTVTDPNGNPSYIVETMFGEFEKRTAPILREIAETGCIPMHEPRSLIAQYMALQYLRTPEWRDLADIEAEIHAKSLVLTHTDETVKQMYREMENREATEKEVAGARYARAHIDEFTIEQSNNNYFLDLIKSATNDIMPHLLQNVHWDLIQADDRVFIASDHPIVFPRPPNMPIGILNAPVVFFPIDPYRTLMLRQGPVQHSRFLAPKRELIIMINQLIADNFYEWVAYHPDQPDALDGLDIPEDPPLMGYSNVMVHGDKRGINAAVAEIRHMIEWAKRSAGVDSVGWTGSGNTPTE